MARARPQPRDDGRSDRRRGCERGAGRAACRPVVRCASCASRAVRRSPRAAARRSSRSSARARGAPPLLARGCSCTPPPPAACVGARAPPAAPRGRRHLLVRRARRARRGTRALRGGARRPAVRARAPRAAGASGGRARRRRRRSACNAAARGRATTPTRARPAREEAAAHARRESAPTAEAERKREGGGERDGVAQRRLSRPPDRDGPGSKQRATTRGAAHGVRRGAGAGNSEATRRRARTTPTGGGHDCALGARQPVGDACWLATPGGVDRLPSASTTARAPRPLRAAMAHALDDRGAARVPRRGGSPPSPSRAQGRPRAQRRGQGEEDADMSDDEDSSMASAPIPHCTHAARPAPVEAAPRRRNRWVCIAYTAPRGRRLPRDRARGTRCTLPPARCADAAAKGEIASKWGRRVGQEMGARPRHRRLTQSRSTRNVCQAGAVLRSRTAPTDAAARGRRWARWRLRGIRLGEPAACGRGINAQNGPLHPTRLRDALAARKVARGRRRRVRARRDARWLRVDRDAARDASARGRTQ